MARRLPLFRILAVLAVMGAVSRAGAQNPAEPGERYRLQWLRERGAEGCVSGAALARLLAQVLEPQSTPVSGPVLRLEGRIEPALEPLRYRAHISVREEQTGELVGERELTTAEAKCSALTPAVLLVLAMSIDPEAAQQGLPAAVTEELRRGREEDVDVWPAANALATAETAEPPAMPPVVVAKSPQALVVTAPVAPRSGFRAELWAGLTLAERVQPELSPGLLLGGGGRWSNGWALSLAALAFWPRAVGVAQSPYVLDDGVDFNTAALALTLCRRLLVWGPSYGEVCGGGLFGVRWVTARALANKNNPFRAFFGPELGLGLGLNAGSHWFVRVGADATLSLRDDRFTYTDNAGNQPLLFAPGRMSGRASLSIGRAL